MCGAAERLGGRRPRQLTQQPRPACPAEQQRHVACPSVLLPAVLQPAVPPRVSVADSRRALLQLPLLHGALGQQLALLLLQQLLPLGPDLGEERVGVPAAVHQTHLQTGSQAGGMVNSSRNRSQTWATHHWRKIQWSFGTDNGAANLNKWTHLTMVYNVTPQKYSRL